MEQPQPQPQPPQPNQELSVREAGRRGGMRTKEKLLKDPNYYKNLGTKGGQATATLYGKDFYREIGKKGGETRRKS